MRQISLKCDFKSLVIILFCFAINQSSRPAVADIGVSGYEKDSNDRFSNSEKFIMSAFDLSGVGQSEQGWWATAISRNVILSAAHAAPSGKVYFFPGNDPKADPVIRKIDKGTKIGSTDLYLAVLDSPLPESITHYRFASTELTGKVPEKDLPGVLARAGSFQGKKAYMLGRSKEPHANFRDQAVGVNIIAGYSENVPFLSNTDNDSIVLPQDSPESPDFTPFEARFAGGDSGGPMFVEFKGELGLVGVNSFIYDPADFENSTTGSGVSYTGNQAKAIKDFIAKHAIQATSSDSSK